ncbi:MAG: CHAD domain-containing protein [Chitinophagaceae bacterium]
MDNQDILYEHWKKEQKLFTDCLSKLKNRLSTKNIHDIRVAIKKLRAYYKLSSLVQSQPETEAYLNKTNTFFKILGRQREIEICIELTTRHEKESHHSFPFWRNQLIHLLKTTKGWTKQVLPQHNTKELSIIGLLLKQKINLTPGKIIEEKLESIINELLTENKKIEKDPHTLRKRLKEVYYWIPLSDFEESTKTFHQTALHEILNDLGNWQDFEILLTRIKHFRKDYLSKAFEENRAIKEFEMSIKNKQKFLLQNATYKIRKWLKEINEKSGG